LWYGKRYTANDNSGYEVIVNCVCELRKNKTDEIGIELHELKPVRKGVGVRQPLRTSFVLLDVNLSDYPFNFLSQAYH
jgi:hypothetical protein